MSNKTLTILSIIILVLIISLGSFIYWQKSTFPKLERTLSDKNNQPEQQTLTKNTKITLTEKQIIINEIMPQSDLDELNVPDAYVQDGQLAGLAVMRAGKITEINNEKQSFVFLNEFMGEKEYTVFVDKNTKIEIDVFETTFKDSTSEKPIKENRYTKNGTFTDLKIGQNINIIANDIISNDKFTAKEITFKLYDTKILN